MSDSDVSVNLRCGRAITLWNFCGADGGEIWRWLDAPLLTDEDNALWRLVAFALLIIAEAFYIYLVARSLWMYCTDSRCFIPDDIWVAM